MIIAAAQTSPGQLDINSNLEDHYLMIEKAAEKGAGLILFPELSITGYDRENARQACFEKNDERLFLLRQLAVSKNITIVAGAPVLMNDELYIGGFVMNPDNTLLLYTKQFLYGTEVNYYKSSFDYNPLLSIEGEKISLAICADIINPLHPENAGKRGTSLYLAGIFFEPSDMERAHTSLSAYAKKHSMNVLMANYTGESWGLPGGGKSAFWNSKGEMIAMLGTDPGLLLVEKKDNEWREKEKLSL